MTKLYLAGKINKNDWRGSFFEHGWDLRNASPHDELITSGKHEYTGPYFLSCDHGCFHGDSSHGMHNDYECWAFNSIVGESCGYSRKEISIYCLNWINQADIIFAWIDSKDCYGTIAEIGYAYAHNKKIWVVYSKDMFEYPLGNVDDIPVDHDMWFIDQMAVRVGIASNPLQLYNAWAVQDTHNIK